MVDGGGGVGGGGRSQGGDDGMIGYMKDHMQPQSPLDGRGGSMDLEEIQQVGGIDRSSMGGQGPNLERFVPKGKLDSLNIFDYTLFCKHHLYKHIETQI